MGSLLNVQVLLAVFTIVCISSAFSNQCYNGNFGFNACGAADSKCCYWSNGGSSSCCNSVEFSSTSSRSFFGYTYSTSCYNGYNSYSTCWSLTDSRCCYKSTGSTSSCCGQSAYLFTYSKYRTGIESGTSNLIGIIVGGSIGGLFFLILIVTVPVCVCAHCAAKKRMNASVGTTAVVSMSSTPVQPMQPRQPPPYSQQGPPPAYNQHNNGTATAPPLGQMYPPQQQYPPQDPAYPPS